MADYLTRFFSRLTSESRIMSEPNLVIALIFVYIFLTEEATLMLLQFWDETVRLILYLLELLINTAAGAAALERAGPLTHGVHVSRAVGDWSKVEDSILDFDIGKVVCPLTVSLTLTAKSELEPVQVNLGLDEVVQEFLSVLINCVLNPLVLQNFFSNLAMKS